MATKHLAKGRLFFPAITIVLLVLSFIAFSDNLITDVGQESNRDPKFIVHGLFMFAWFSMLVVQANFIRQGDYKTHMRWGMYGMLVAIGVFISTVNVFVQVYKGWDAMPYFAKANRFFMLGFAVLVLLAYLHRRNGVRHKRFMLVATLTVLEPILSRVAGNLGLEPVEAVILIIWHALFLSLFIHDRRTLGCVHPISWMGLVWVYAVYGLSVIV